VGVGVTVFTVEVFTARMNFGCGVEFLRSTKVKALATP